MRRQGGWSEVKKGGVEKTSEPAIGADCFCVSSIMPATPFTAYLAVSKSIQICL